MGWVPLGEGQLLGEGGKWNSPRNLSLLAGYLQQAVQASRDRVGERQIVCCGEGDDMSGGDVGTDERTDRDFGVAGLRSSEHGKQSKLLALGQSSARDGDG